MNAEQKHLALPSGAIVRLDGSHLITMLVLLASFAVWTKRINRINFAVSVPTKHYSAAMFSNAGMSKNDPNLNQGVLELIHLLLNNIVGCGRNSLKFLELWNIH